MQPSRPSVLILTHHADYYTVDRVAAAIERRGLRAVRFDTDRFPAQARLSAHLGGDDDRLEIHAEDEVLDSRDVRAVWLRHIWDPARSADVDPRFREGAAREASAALRAAWDALHAARWIDPPETGARARNKLLQLRLAQEAGLAIPRTVMTNDPKEARAFFAAHGGRMVAKMLTPLSVGMEANGPFVYTSRVRESDLAAADGLRHAPMVFQEEIAKDRELRVVAVEGELFVGSIDASRSARGAVDWRRSDPGECGWEHDRLPQDCARALRGLLAALGLRYGAADLIRTPQGRHVFLEVNPAGEWGMLERDLGLPIAEAIARALCEE